MDDHYEVSLLVSRLGRWLDEKSPDEGRSLFTDDAEASTPGGVAKGVDALVEMARRDHTVPTQHLITNPIIDVHGDRAAIGANLMVVFVREDGPHLLGERYALEARRTESGWRLSRVRTHPVWEIAKGA